MATSYQIELDQNFEKGGIDMVAGQTISSFWRNPKEQGLSDGKHDTRYLVWKEGLGYRPTKRKVRWLRSRKLGFLGFRFLGANFE